MEINNGKQATMFISIFILLLPFLMIAFLPIIVKSLFSLNELEEMGICLENLDTSSSYAFQQSEAITVQTPVTCCNI